MHLLTDCESKILSVCSQGPEQGGASSTSGTVASGVTGCSGASKQAHHEQGTWMRNSLIPLYMSSRSQGSAGFCGKHEVH